MEDREFRYSFFFFSWIFEKNFAGFLPVMKSYDFWKLQDFVFLWRIIISHYKNKCKIWAFKKESKNFILLFSKYFSSVLILEYNWIIGGITNITTKSVALRKLQTLQRLLNQIKNRSYLSHWINWFLLSSCTWIKRKYVHKFVCHVLNFNRICS